MSARTKARTTTALTEIRVKVPTRDAARARRAIESIIALICPGRPLRDEKINDNALYSFEQVFPDSTPGGRLRGLRTREGITQRELAEKLGIQQHHVSEMEKGTRTIGLAMAKRIAKVYDIAYQVFL
ncbi:MAG: helix-turn-helix domain-containing protein [Planctomycetes bacterium]|nr:helix-turn-helix domain-containing protein [Planctomycetota bacterium]